tara:strand:+ start:414 stop:563 length:150 start_codon:yes stop_codon:yes gene_type:complete
MIYIATGSHSRGVKYITAFDKRKVDALNTAKYEAVPILDYLVGINGQAS